MTRMLTQPAELGSFLTELQLAEAFGISPRTLQAWRVRGGGPHYVKIGRAVRYPKAEAEAWAAARLRESTAIR